MNALIVEDDEIASDVVANALGQLGHRVDVARNGREALEKLRRDPARLVITDWEMPEMSGIELCRAIRREDFTGYIYIIMLTGRDGEEQSMEGMYAGADDFLRKPLKPSELLVCLKTAERILSLETRDLAMFAMAKLAESRDPETGAHLERVQSYARVLAQQLSTLQEFRAAIDGEFVRLIHQTSPLHDIGKVGIPDRILLKPGQLDVQEYAVMKTHTNIGARTLEAALERFPNAKFLHMARDIAAAHHEKFDGKGYPRGLAGDRIPLCARIVALADVYDALTSRRIYKEPISHEQAKATIFAESGSHFDPAIVNAFLASEQQFIAIKQKLGESQNDRDIKVASPVLSAMAVSPFKVLVVEDHAGDLEFLKDFLASAGHAILTAADGAEALRIFLEQAPRAVIADCTTPGMDGVELCRCIRATESGKYAHFIIMTIDSAKAKAAEAFAVGVDDYITKPLDRSEVLGRMRAGLRAAWLHDELARKNAESSEINAQLARLNESLQKAATTDELTGLANRRLSMARLGEQIALADRYAGPLTLAIVDIDCFKRINDSYGHDAGDMVLRQIAAHLQENVRATDWVGRIGGEEFLLIFPGQTAQEAGVCAEACRAAVASHRFTFAQQQVGVTISIGMADRQTPSMERSDLLKEADLGLYAAKRAGRNKVYLGADELVVSPAHRTRPDVGTDEIENAA